MKATHFHFQWLPEGVPSGFRTGVSLHSHTLHSKESLDFIYAAAKRSAPVRSVLRYWEARYCRHHSVPLDLRRGWWTPPLAPLDAHNVEAHQIESLGLAPIVSLTDHDDIEAPMSVQSIDPSRTIPVSVEWTVPYGATFFHLGIHNIPSRRARSLMATLAEFTANPHDAHVTGILSTLHAIAGVLLVFNHPLWDEKGVGSAVHREATLRFLRQ